MRYVLPDIDISPGASEVTGLSMAVIAGRKALLKDGEKVETTSLHGALSDFLTWLPARSILYAHNAKQFDMKVILRSLISTHLLPSAEEKIIGFVDTLPLFRDLQPKNEGGHSLGALHRHAFGREVDGAHDAAGDVNALFDLLKKHSPAANIYSNHSIQMRASLQLLELSRRRLDREMVLKRRLHHGQSKVLSNYMIGKIAASGLSYAHLKLAFQRDRVCGIAKLLGELMSTGKARVTQDRKVMLALNAHFHSDSCEEKGRK